MKASALAIYQGNSKLNNFKVDLHLWIILVDLTIFIVIRSNIQMRNDFLSCVIDKGRLKIFVGSTRKSDAQHKIKISSKTSINKMELYFL